MKDFLEHPSPPMALTQKDRDLSSPKTSKGKRWLPLVIFLGLAGASYGAWFWKFSPNARIAGEWVIEGDHSGHWKITAFLKRDGTFKIIEETKYPRYHDVVQLHEGTFKVHESKSPPLLELTDRKEGEAPIYNGNTILVRFQGVVDGVMSVESIDYSDPEKKLEPYIWRKQ